MHEGLEHLCTRKQENVTRTIRIVSEDLVANLKRLLPAKDRTTEHQKKINKCNGVKHTNHVFLKYDFIMILKDSSGDLWQTVENSLF